MPSSIGIPCARNRSVSDMATALPSVANTIRGWFRPLVLIIINSSVADLKVRRGRKKLNCQGVIQPFTAQRLKLKPEGERRWKWKLLFTGTEVDLNDGDDFTIRDVPYRVMGKLDWSDYGCNVYELVEDYDESADTDEQP